MSKESTAPAAMPSEIVMRRALAARDAAFDGAFVYGVLQRECTVARPVLLVRPSLVTCVFFGIRMTRSEPDCGHASGASPAIRTIKPRSECRRSHGTLEHTRMSHCL
jgi:hypothetical protein